MVPSRWQMEAMGKLLNVVAGNLLSRMTRLWRGSRVLEAEFKRFRHDDGHVRQFLRMGRRIEEFRKVERSFAALNRSS